LEFHDPNSWGKSLSFISFHTNPSLRARPWKGCLLLSKRGRPAFTQGLDSFIELQSSVRQI